MISSKEWLLKVWACIYLNFKILIIIDGSNIFLITFRNVLLKEKIENVIIDLLKQVLIGRGRQDGNP
jgi:hypothetical protein